jgi:hypothetical protein
MMMQGAAAIFNGESNGNSDRLFNGGYITCCVHKGDFSDLQANQFCSGISFHSDIPDPA